MLLKEIHISGFGKYIHRDMSFSEGINVIYGENGSGKSTLHAYLKSMLFGMERGRGRAAGHDAYSHYYPWEGQAAYGGSLTISAGEEDYLIERRLDTKNRSLSVRKPESGQLAAASQEELDALLGHITEETYRNTISIEQLKAATDGSLSESLKNHLSSITLSGTSTLDVTKALSSLQEKKKGLKQQLNPEASVKYQEIFAKICETEDKLKSLGKQPDKLAADIKQMESSLDTEDKKRCYLDKDIENIQESIENHTLAAVKDIDLYQERLRDAYTAHRLASGDNARHGNHSFPVRNIFLLLFSFVIFSALALGSMFYEELPFTNTPFPLPKLPFLILFFAGAFFSLVFVAVLSARSKKEDSDSAAMAMETEQFLKNEYETHLGTSDITEENRILMKKKFMEYAVLLDSLKQKQELSDASLKATVAIQEKLRAARTEMEHWQKQTWEFEQACSALSALEEEKQALSQVMENNKSLTEKIEAVTMAEKTITALASKIHEAFSPLLNNRVSEIMGAVTGGLYNRFHIDENLGVTVRSGGRTIPLESLSRGTIEQVYLALRISAVEILFPSHTLPILLDDTFAYYDDTRLNNTLKWLSEYYPGQVFLFTSHKREAAFLSRLKVPYRLLILT